MCATLFDTMVQEPAFDGLPAKLIKLENKQGMSVTFMDIGATWLSCLLPIKNQLREVLLGVTSMADFKKQETYLGATVGRYANRIAGGKFIINEQYNQLAINQAGNTLHGGPIGFDKRRWAIQKQTSNSVTFTLISESNDQGFPGRLNVAVCYHLTEKNQVIISYHATTDQATPVNLTNHAYFNLAGAESGVECKQHFLYINADNYLPVDSDGIPLGELESVGANSFDFRQSKVIAQDFLSDAQQQAAKGYDHAYLLNADCQQGQAAAKLSCADKSVTLTVFTDKPALQLYTGNWLAGTPNRCAGEYQDYAGVALETQFLPDSPNRPQWSHLCPILKPNEQYNYQTTYQFTIK